MAFAKELQVALTAAQRSGAYLWDAYQQFVPIPNAPSNISTEADRGSQEIILQYLAEQFPNDALCAEENTPTLAKAVRSGERIWIVDPIDGTRGFAMKNGEFSVMIGFVAAGVVVVGVVLEPALNRVTYAQRGGGCWTLSAIGEAIPCRVTTTPRLADATLVQSHARTPPSPVQTALQPKHVVETYSAGVKMAMVARGEVDLYVNTYPRFSDWDICAGDILVSEAGGRSSELTGAPLVYGRAGNPQAGGLLSTNGLIHAAAIERLRAVPLV
jgi:3'(2'), 5'-bisphosphate nucleotidase